MFFSLTLKLLVYQVCSVHSKGGLNRELVRVSKIHICWLHIRKVVLPRKEYGVTWPQTCQSICVYHCK